MTAQAMASLLLYVVFVGVPVCAVADTYHVHENGQLRIVYGDPNEIRPKEWQVRLYRNGEPASGPNHWGLIMGKTAAAVMQELKDSQEFQKRYARWAGYDYTTEKHTYFNPLGPIAVIEAPRSVSAEAVRVASQVAKILQMIREAHSKLQLILFNKPRPPNPFSEVGKVTKEYGDLLLVAARNVRAIERTVRLEGPTAALFTQLDTVERELSLHAQRFDRVVQAGLSDARRGDGTCDGYRLLPGERCCRDKDDKDITMVCARGSQCPPPNMICE